MANTQGDERPVVLRQWSYGNVEVKEHAEYKTKPGPPKFGEDAIIAVMGMTGAGKSSFISLLTDENVKIGHDLYSSTTDTHFFGFRHAQGKGILIDTPGFDDTTRSDSEILKEIAACFCNLYDKGTRLDGLIYLHRISDPRMGGSALKNLHMFQRLCGKRSLPNVVLATTMWGEVQRQSGGMAAAEKREEQLRATDEFWGGMVRGGSHIMRHTNDRKSAEAILSMIISIRKKTTLDIQIEMVEKKLSLDQTTAGQYLKQEYAELRHRYEIEAEEAEQSKKLAIQEKDAEMIAILNEEKTKVTAEIVKAQHEDQKLKLDFRTLHAEKSRQVREVVAQGNPVQAQIQCDASKDPQILTEEVEELQRLKIEELERSIERQEEENRSEKLKQERQIRANAVRATNATTENEALQQRVKRLQRDKVELERLVNQQGRRTQASSHHHAPPPYGETVVLQRTLPGSQPQQQAHHRQQQQQMTMAQSAASYSWKVWKWTYG